MFAPSLSKMVLSTILFLSALGALSEAMSLGAPSARQTVSSYLEKRQAQANAPQAVSQYSRAPSYRVKRAVGVVSEAGRAASSSALSAQKPKRAAENVADLGTLVARALSTLSKRSVGTTAPSGISDRAMFARQPTSAPGFNTQSKMGRGHAWKRE